MFFASSTHMISFQLYFIEIANDCNCGCNNIEIISDGPVSTAKEYYDDDTLNIQHYGLQDYRYWENHTLFSKKIEYPREKIVAVDLHSPNSCCGNISYQEKYKKLRRSTHLEYKQLLGSYEFFTCLETNRYGITSTSPVYKKILDNKTDAFLYRSKTGINWQVICALV